MTLRVYGTCRKFWVCVSLFNLYFPLVMAVQVESISSQQPSLDYMMIEVNGAKKAIHADGVLTVIKGDKIKIERAILKDRSVNAEVVNLEGYPGGNKKSPAEDRGILVEAGSRFLKHWSLEKKGMKYRISAKTDNYTHGEVFLKFLDPKLIYASVKINDKERILRNGEVLVLKKTDMIKVNQIVTNMEELGEDATFQIIPLGFEKEVENLKAYELRFYRKKQVFAKIPLFVENR